MFKAVLALIAATLVQNSTPAERFVAAVKAGADFSTGEFASAVSPDDRPKLASLAKCVAGPPKTGAHGNVMILWDCAGVKGATSMAAMLSFDEGEVVSVLVMTATVVRTQ